MQKYNHPKNQPLPHYVKTGRTFALLFWIPAAVGIVIFNLFDLRFANLSDSICLFRLIFGIVCPFCGGTRMIDSIIHLDFATAFLFNPLMFLIFIFILIFLIWFTVDIFGKNPKRLHFPDHPTKIIFGIMILFIIYTVMRNK